MPKISVIMPVYNAERYIEKTLRCLLNQTFSDFELIIIDDCGTDRSMQYVAQIQDHRIRIINNKKNMGIAFSRNLGLSVATGEYIALMDDDDLSPRDRFEKQSYFLDVNPQIDVVGGRCKIIDAFDRDVKLLQEPLNNPKYIKASLMFYNPIANGSSMMRRAFIDNNFIRYQENCMGIEDYRFWIDCSLHGNITNLPDILLDWRQTDSNETNRCVKINTLARSIKYAELQKYAFQKNGFCFTDEEYCFICRMFPEHIISNSATREELERLYDIFISMIKQSYELELPNRKEIEKCCKKMLSLCQENSEIWICPRR